MSEICLSTVTCDNFCTGTTVLLHSFLRLNPWFDGDIVVIIDSLSEHSRNKLNAIYPVKYLQRNQVIEEKIKHLRTAVPALRQDLHLRLLSLEIFRLKGYERIVFIDSDAFCTGDLKPLFDCQADFAAVRDGFAYEDKVDQILTRHKLLPISEKQRYGQDALPDSFNSGCMSVAGKLATMDTYNAIVKQLDDIELWQGFGQRGFTDQMLLNRFFQGQVHLLDGRFNFLPFMESYLQLTENISMLDARVIHFAGRIKPWLRFNPADITALAPHYLKYLLLWEDTWHQLNTDESTRINAALNQYQWIEEGLDGKLSPCGRIDDLLS